MKLLEAQVVKMIMAAHLQEPNFQKKALSGIWIGNDLYNHPERAKCSLVKQVKHPHAKGKYFCIIEVKVGKSRHFYIILTDGKTYFHYGRHVQYNSQEQAERQLKIRLKLIEKIFTEHPKTKRVLDKINRPTKLMDYLYPWKEELYSRISYNKENQRWQVRRYYGTPSEDGKKFVFYHGNGNPTPVQSVATLEEAMWLCLHKQTPKVTVEKALVKSDKLSQATTMSDISPCTSMKISERAATAIVAKIQSVVDTELHIPLRATDLVASIIDTLKPHLCEDCIERLEKSL